MSELNLTPSSTGLSGPESGILGVTELLQMLSGPVGRVTVTVTPVDGLPRLTVSSTARLMIVTDPVAPGVQV